jgi:hypothetical protein
MGGADAVTSGVWRVTSHNRNAADLRVGFFISRVAMDFASVERNGCFPPQGGKAHAKAWPWPVHLLRSEGTRPPAPLRTLRLPAPSSSLRPQPSGFSPHPFPLTPRSLLHAPCPMPPASCASSRLFLLVPLSGFRSPLSAFKLLLPAPRSPLFCFRTRGLGFSFRPCLRSAASSE